MNQHVSYFEQVAGADGKPDMVVHLPNQGHITVDSKFPLQAFLEAMASVDDAFRQLKLHELPRKNPCARRIKELAKKGYWEQFQPSPELVIMFIPVESCLMAAYECDPEIVEFALSQKVILASPITLLGFMKAIAYGWQQFVISKNAKVILEQGKELHKRAVIWLSQDFRKTGEKLGSVIDAYNASVSSLQSRFFPAALREQSDREELSEIGTLNKGLQFELPAPEDVAGEAKLLEPAPSLASAAAGGVPAADVAGEAKLLEPAPLADTGMPARPSWHVGYFTRDGKSQEGPFSCDDLAMLLDSQVALESTVMLLAEGETQGVPVRVFQERYKASIRVSGRANG